MTSSSYTEDDLATIRKLRQVRRREEYRNVAAYDRATAEERAIHGAAFARMEHFRKTGERGGVVDREARYDEPFGQPPDDSREAATDHDLPACGPATEPSLKSATPPKRKGPRPAPKL